MNYRHLGKAGLQVSELSLGSWVTFGNQLNEDHARECMVAAYEAGVNFFDNAEVYAGGQSETIMGAVLKETGWRRESYLVSTKIFWGGTGPNDRGLSYKHIVEGVNNALKRLQLDYVDLVYCHRPDPHTPIEETVRAMDLIIRQGKAFYWGTSEWSAAEIMRADGIARQYCLTPPSMEQPQYNMFTRQRFEVEYRSLYTMLGYGTTIWSPLASGMLTGKYNNGIPGGSRGELKGFDWLKPELTNQERVAKVKKLQPIAQDLGCSLAQMALAWCLKNPNVSTVITGASRVEQVRENLASADLVAKLTSDVMERIELVLDNKPQPEEED
jgi:voltage-dependent potassium channel beta subunit